MKTYDHTSGRLSTLCLWLVITLSLSMQHRMAQSQGSSPRCFGNDPARAVCVDDVFLSFWEHHGGLATFGEPLAASIRRSTPDGDITVQYFEQARLEHHPHNAPPYHVLLGRIGEERMTALGRGAEIAEAENRAPECRYFRATRHNVCGQMLDYWRSHGLRFDGDPAITDAESLALLGLPLTAVNVEVGSSGEVLRTQWFERAKLVETANVVSAAPLGRDSVFPEAPLISNAGTPTPSTVLPVTPTAQPQATVDPPITPTSAPISHVSAPTVPCNRNVPEPANGLQVWVITESDQMIVCTRLILDGNAVAGANATVYRHYDNVTRPALAHTTGLHSGVADFIFYTGAPLGRPDRLEAVVSYQGVVYRATVSP